MLARSLGVAELRFTGRAEGDLGLGPAPDRAPAGALLARRAAVVAAPWTWLRQVHGADVVTVDQPGAHAGATADAAVTATRGAALAVFTADCAPVALVSDDGVLAVAHAGWRGLVAGVLPRTVEAMRAAGARGEIRAVLGPCIEASCYEFGAAELDEAARVLGDEVRARTADGRPAFDVRAGVRSSLARARVTDVDDVAVCTACSPAHWSHRRDRGPERQALVAWIP